MSILGSWTFEKTMKWYCIFAIVIAFLIPEKFAIEDYVSIDPHVIPYVGWLLNVDGRLRSLTTFFFVMWIVFPFVIFLMIAKPYVETPRRDRLTLLQRCIVILALDVVMVIGMVWIMYYMPDLKATPYAGRGTAVFHLIAMYRPMMGVLGGLLMAATALVAYIVVVKTPQMWLEYFRS